MKPIKPKPMPKALETWLSRAVANAGSPVLFPIKDVRSILAALAYDRKRAEDAEARANIADHLVAASKPGDADDHVRHVEAMRIHLGDARPSDFARVRAEVVTPECQRAFTEDVVPKPRKTALERVVDGVDDRMARRKATYRLISKQFEQAERERKKKG